MTGGEDDRWSVRGVTKPVRHLAGELARREGLALGPWLTALIRRAGEEGAVSGPATQRLNMLEVAVGILCQRVTALEIDQELGGRFRDPETGGTVGALRNQ